MGVGGGFELGEDGGEGSGGGAERGGFDGGGVGGESFFEGVGAVVEARKFGNDGGFGAGGRAGDGHENDREEENDASDDEDELGLFVEEGGLDRRGFGGDLI